MTDPQDSPAASDDAGAASWRDRAVERSLRTARAKAVLRSDRFIAAAVEIVAETGRTDFTVQELVERSKASLRTFYQHFGSKDELLLALFEEVVRAYAEKWTQETGDIEDPAEASHVLLSQTYGAVGDEHGTEVRHALSVYHTQLATSRPEDFARVLFPLREVVLGIITRGITSGAFRHDISAEALATMVLSALVGAERMYSLADGLGDPPPSTRAFWQFCIGGLSPSAGVESARQSRRVRGR